ncbi:MAG: PSD1 and planctomycete cytochrome C domain-containing protein [Planctomycetota bacterium]
MSRGVWPHRGGDLARRLAMATHLAGMVICLTCSCDLTACRADDKAAFFESRIRPFFERACVECHSGDQPAGGVRLTDRPGWSDAGVIEPGRPASSRLLEVLRSADPDETMPPPDSGKTVSSGDIRDVEAWIAAGALDPRESAEVVSHPGPKLRSRVFAITPQDESWWAFQPPALPLFSPSESAFSAPQKVDLLVSRGIEVLSDATGASVHQVHPVHEGGLPSPPATPREIVRRAYSDLWGLPPTPEAVAAFAADPAESAWRQIVDDLLASHHYGERWAQHWLDWVRYAETNGYERDGDKPEAWRYRDYVIRSFAADKPYDRFLVEQLAGDEWAAVHLLPEHEPEQWRDAIIATGFLRLHQWDDEPDSSDQAELDDADDVLVTLSSAFLGITVGCARCHDHKYDPISQHDYYALLAFLRGIDPYGQPKRGGGNRGTGQIQQIIGATPNATPLPEKSLAVAELLEPKATFVLHRGDRNSPRERVEPAPPAILQGRAGPLPTITPVAGSSGRRLALATWLSDPRHPLTARVLVNRVWQRHFGTAIVPTPDDFGQTGLPPANLALLDFLTREFVDSGWSLHHLHRVIMTSHAYRMTSRAGSIPAVGLAGGLDARLGWRQTIRRLDAEAIRDSILAITGHLNSKQSGPSVYPILSEEVRVTANPASFRWPESSAEQQDCRSIYLVVTRSLPVPFLDALDRVTVSAPTVVRPITTTSPQSLLLLNDAWIHQQAARLLDRLRREAGHVDAARVKRLWQLVYQRDPTAAEIATTAAFLQEQTQAAHQRITPAEPVAADPTDAAWQSLCRAVLTSNEAIYIE